MPRPRATATSVPDHLPTGSWRQRISWNSSATIIPASARKTRSWPAGPLRSSEWASSSSGRASAVTPTSSKNPRRAYSA